MLSENWPIPGWPWVSWTMFGMLDSLQVLPVLYKMSWSSTEIFTRSFIKGFLIEVRQREIRVDTQNICILCRSKFQWDLLNHFTAFFWRGKFFNQLGIQVPVMCHMILETQTSSTWRELINFVWYFYCLFFHRETSVTGAEGKWCWNSSPAQRFNYSKQQNLLFHKNALLWCHK